MISKIYEHRVQITKFVVSGVLCAIIEIILMKVLSNPKALPNIISFENEEFSFPISNFIATGSAIVLNYFISIWWVFDQGKHSKRREFAYFMGISLVSLIASWLVFGAFHRIINKPIDLGFYAIGEIVFCKAIAIGIISIGNYIFKKKLVFRS